jgi:hypothetical protein
MKALIKICLKMLRETLGSMPAQQADRVVESVAMILEEIVKDKNVSNKTQHIQKKENKK